MNTKKITLKIISAAIAGIFLCQQVVWAAQDVSGMSGAVSGYKVGQRVDKLANMRISGETADVDDAYRGGTEGTVINIQDCHSSLSAQYSIVNVLKDLLRNYDLDVVAIEGGAGYIDTSILRSFPDAEAKEKTAAYLMKEGKISAGEFFSVTTEKDIALYGAEDSSLYRENLRMFREIYEKNCGNIIILNALLEELKSRESAVYSSELNRAVYKSRLHRESRISFDIYWGFMEKVCVEENIPTDNYKNIRCFMDSVRLEKSIDFTEATSERKKLIDVLVTGASREDLEELVKRSVFFEKGRIDQIGYHRWLLDFAAAKGVYTDRFPELRKFNDYAAGYRGLDIIGLEDELERIEEKILEKLFSSQEERQLYSLVRYIELLKALFEIKLSRRDAGYLKKKLNSFEAEFSVVLSGIERTEFRNILGEAEKALEFYEIAEKRDRAMLANTVSAMRREGKHIAALISGGHHSAGLTGLMKEKGLSYLVLMPKTFNDESRPYVAVLTKKTGPYRELVSSGAYDLALAAYFGSGDVSRLEEVMAFVIGQRVLEGKDTKADIRKWYSSYKKAYNSLSPARIRAMKHAPVTPEELKKYLVQIKILRNDGRYCEVLINGTTYRVSDGQLETSRFGKSGVSIDKKKFSARFYEMLENLFTSAGKYPAIPAGIPQSSYELFMDDTEFLAGVDGVITDFDGVDMDHDEKIISDGMIGVKRALSDAGVYNITVTGCVEELIINKYGGYNRAGRVAGEKGYFILTDAGATGLFFDSEGRRTPIAGYKETTLGGVENVNKLEDAVREAVRDVLEKNGIDISGSEINRLIESNPYGITAYVHKNKRVHPLRVNIARAVRKRINDMKTKGIIPEEITVRNSAAAADIMATSKGRSVLQMIKLLKLRRVVLIADSVGTGTDPGNDRDMLALTKDDLLKAGIDWDVDWRKIYVGREKDAELPERVIAAPRGRKESEPARDVYNAVVRAKNTASGTSRGWTGHMVRIVSGIGHIGNILPHMAALSAAGASAGISGVPGGLFLAWAARSISEGKKAVKEPLRKRANTTYQLNAFAVGRETALEVPYHRPEEKLFELKHRKTGEISRFALTNGEGKWAPLYTPGDGQVIFAHIRNEEGIEKVLDDYFVFRLDVGQTGTPVDEQLAGLGISSERLLYYRSADAQPIPVYVDAVQSAYRHMDTAHVIGTFKESIGMVKLLSYYGGRFIGKEQRWSVWRIDPDKRDKKLSRAVVKPLITPFNGYATPVSFKRHKKKAKVPDLMAFDRMGRNELIAEIGSHDIMELAQKYVNGIRAALGLDHEVLGRMYGMPERFVLYADVILQHKFKKYQHSLTKGQISRINTEAANCKRQFKTFGVTRNEARNFLINTQEVINHMVESYERRGGEIPLPERLLFVVDNGIKLSKRNGKTVPVKAEFTKKIVTRSLMEWAREIGRLVFIAYSERDEFSFSRSLLSIAFRAVRLFRTERYYVKEGSVAFLDEFGYLHELLEYADDVMRHIRMPGKGQRPERDIAEDGKTDVHIDRPQLAPKYRILGMVSGTVVGTVLLSATLGALALPVALAISAAVLLPGWLVHEAGHLAGGDFGKTHVKDMRAGPLASLVLFLLTSVFTVLAASGMLPEAQLFSIPFYAIMAIFSANCFVHIFADEGALFHKIRLEIEFRSPFLKAQITTGHTVIADFQVPIVMQMSREKGGDGGESKLEKAARIFTEQAEKAKSAPETLRTANDNLRKWLTDEQFREYQPALGALIDLAENNEEAARELYDSFWRTIPFGTGGRRWRMGIGPNRMNAYMAAMTAQGHVEYLKSRYKAQVRRGDAVVGAWDVRAFHKYYAETPGLAKYRGVIDQKCPVLSGLSSEDLSKIVGLVYAGNGIRYIHSTKGRSTPWLSFLVNKFGDIDSSQFDDSPSGKALAEINNIMGGIVLSSSHNPYDNNGTKFYENSGGQAPPEIVQRLMDLGDSVRAINYFGGNLIYEQGQDEAFRKAVEDGDIITLEGENLAVTDAAYTEAIIKEVKDLYTTDQWEWLEPYIRQTIVSFSAINGTGDTNVLPAIEGVLGAQVIRHPEDEPTWEFPLGYGNIPNPEAEKTFNTVMEIGIRRTLGWLLEEKAAAVEAVTDEDGNEISMVSIESELGHPASNVDELLAYIMKTRGKFVRGIKLAVDDKDDETERKIRDFSRLNNICLMTDPDSDRVGLGMLKMERQGDMMSLRWVSGNDNDESGIILFRYRLEKMLEMAEREPAGEALIRYIEERRPQKSKSGNYQIVMVNTVVSNPLEKKIADVISGKIETATDGRVTVKTVKQDVGFKFTGEIIDIINKGEFTGLTGEFMKKAEVDLDEAFFGMSFEEGEGGLIGSNGSVDKDSGVIGVALTVLDAELLAKGMTMHDYLMETYRKYGYSKMYLEPMVMTGEYGFVMINEKIMKHLREEVLPQLKAGGEVKWGDYTITGGMDHYDFARAKYGADPAQWDQAVREAVNILEFYAKIDGVDVTIVARPSGTEPKHKNVVGTVGPEIAATDDLDKYIAKINALNRAIMDAVMIVCYDASGAEYESMVRERPGVYRMADLSAEDKKELLKIFPIVVSTEVKLAVYFPLRDWIREQAQEMAGMDPARYSARYTELRESIEAYLVNFKETDGVQFVEEAVLLNLTRQMVAVESGDNNALESIRIQAILWFGEEIGEGHYKRLVSEAEEASNGYKIPVGLSSGIYDRLDRADIERLKRKCGASSLVRVEFSEDKDKMIAELNKKTKGGRCISALVAEDAVDNMSDKEKMLEELEGIISGFVTKTRKDIIKLLNPAVTALTEANVAAIRDIETLEKVMGVFVRTQPDVSSMKLKEKSVYELRIESLYRQQRLLTYSEGKAGEYFAGLAPKSTEDRRYIVTAVEDVLDLRLLAESIKERRELMKVTVPGQDPVRDFVIIRNKEITEENIEQVLTATGLVDYLTSAQIIVLGENDTLTPEETLEKIEAQTGERPLRKQVAIGQKAEIIEIDRENPGEMFKAGKRDSFLLVQLDKGQGLVSQLYRMILEIIANNDTLPEAITGEMIQIKGYNYYIYKLPAAVAKDLEAERRRYERYVIEVLVKA